MAKTAFLFPGQGAQAVGMAVDVCRSVPAAQRLFDEAATILGYDLLRVCAEGPAERLNSTAVSQPQEKVEELSAKARSAGTVQIANLLCPGNIVVSGAKAACDAIEQLAPEFGAMKTIRLAVAGAFHTDIMKPADATLAAALAKTALQSPRVPVWSNVDARPHSDPEEIRGLLVRQVVQPVLWEKTMRNLLAEGVTKFYEIGPGRVLAGLLKRVERKVECVNVG